ncbi:dATP/dGTP diphosphohydrolase domain-containing protein [Streptomyces sp. NPDC048142]|uniref:dATP/dGTP diphosphohydrolase domain-containing protein n=1 Tax=Streptomyces sp. NPDC048142 TaxID=3365501 RepID=UPI00371ED903
MTYKCIAAAQQPRYGTKDSGHRGELSSGMLRGPDTCRPQFDLLGSETVPFGEPLFTHCAALMERGVQKRISCNWEKADSVAQLERMKASAFRHFMQRLTGETDEDHAAAVVFNLLAAETTSYRIEQRVKNGELGF